MPAPLPQATTSVDPGEGMFSKLGFQQNAKDDLPSAVHWNMVGIPVLKDMGFPVLL